MAHEAQTRYSQLVDLKLRASLVTKDGVVCNNRYEGDPKAGAVKVPVRDTEVAVSDYNKATGATATQGTTSYITVTIDKDKAVNEIIDGFDAASVPDNLVADRLDSAGYSLAAVMDKDCIDVLEAGGTINANKAALTKETVYETFVDLAAALSQANVPNDGRRFALVSPATYALLLKDTTNFIRQSSLSQELVMKGIVGQIAGFNVIECNRLMFENTTVVSSKKTTTEIIVGHPDWVTRIPEWSVPVHVQDLSASGTYIGASAVQGRKIYAHKITKSQTVIVKRKEV